MSENKKSRRADVALVVTHSFAGDGEIADIILELAERRAASEALENGSDK